MILEPLLIIEPNPVRLTRILEIFNPFPSASQQPLRAERLSREQQSNRQPEAAMEASEKLPVVFQIQLAQTTEQALAAIEHAKEMKRPFLLTLLSTEDQGGFCSLTTYQKVQTTDTNISILSYGPSLSAELSHAEITASPMSAHIGPSYNFQELWDICKSVAYYKIALRKQDELALDKEAFLQDLSHDLGTPLQTIMGLSDSLLKLEDPKGDQLDLLQEISDQSHRVCKALEKHQNNPDYCNELKNIEPMSLNECLSEVLPLAQALAKNYGIQLELQLPDPPLWILGDSSKIRQAMLELINFLASHSTSKMIQINLQQKYEDAQFNIQCKLPPTVNKTPFLQPRSEHLGNAAEIIKAHGSCIQVEYHPFDECTYLFQIPLSLTHYMNAY